jgi:predicted CopG family antitoxin
MIEKGSTIQIKNGTRERLKRIGHKGQSYDEVINRLLDLKTNKRDLIDRRVQSIESSQSPNP